MKLRGTPEERRTWRQNRADCLAVISEKAARIIARPVWLVCLCCMRDTTGAEIERQLAGCADAFRLAVLDVCLRERFDGYGRTWEDWRARRLAVICILFAYLCQRSEYHGAVVWTVRGVPKGALQVATRISTMIGGMQVKHAPHLNTVWTDLAELRAAGILDVEQFAACKVPAWARGKARVNSKGQTEQWAFSYYFLRICPWRNGADGGRVIPVPRGSIRRRLKSPKAETQQAIDGRREREREQQAAAPAASEIERWERETAEREERERYDREAEQLAALAREQSAQVRERLKQRRAPSPTPAQPNNERERFRAVYRQQFGTGPPEAD